MLGLPLTGFAGMFMGGDLFDTDEIAADACEMNGYIWAGSTFVYLYGFIHTRIAICKCGGMKGLAAAAAKNRPSDDITA